MPSIDLPQGTLHYDEDGSGPPVVFLHGYLMDGELWKPVVERLRGDARCISLHLPLGAHRTPMAADADLSAKGIARIVNDALAALELTDVTLVGNDSGGAIAQVVACEHPERIGRLVLTSCDAFDNYPPKLFRPLIAASKVPGALRAALTPLKLKPNRYLPISYGWLSKTPLDDVMVKRWVLTPFSDKAIMRDLVKVTQGLDTSVTMETAEKLHRFDKPALILFAADDKLFPLDHAARLTAILPQAVRHDIADSRTYVMIDQPEETARRIREFVPTATRPAASRPESTPAAG